MNYKNTSKIAEPCLTHRSNALLPQPHRKLLPYAPVVVASASEYFPVSSALPKHRLQGREDKAGRFFAHFEANCSIFYERVQRQPTHPCRKLAPILETFSKPPPVSPLTDEYQFSFKKPQDTASRNQPLQQNTYHLQAPERPKIKLRKFHSLIAIKRNQSTVEAVQQPQMERRRNQSMAREEGRSIRLLKGKTLRHHTENEQDERTLVLKGNGAKTEAFEAEKERLGRIRRELNQIYNTQKGASQIRLKLY